MSHPKQHVIDEWHPDCLWVRDGEGIATRKYDGTACLVEGGKLYKRRTVREGKIAPADFREVDLDPRTGARFGWVPVGLSPEDRYHIDAFRASFFASIPGLPLDGTYELVGPKVNGGKETEFKSHVFIRHAGTTCEPGAKVYEDAPRTFGELRDWLRDHLIEGLVWHHMDGRMAKIKRRDFGLVW